MAKTRLQDSKKRPAAGASSSKHHRAGNGRENNAKPQASSTVISLGSDTAAGTAGTTKQAERDRGRQRKGDQQRQTREFAFEHPTASDKLNRPINFSHFSSQHGADSGRFAEKYGDPGQSDAHPR